MGARTLLAVMLIALAILAVMLLTLSHADAHTRHPAHRAHRVHHHVIRHATTGIASWYGWQFDGLPMADGQKFDPMGSSAAHRSLPLGSRVKVTNLRNRRSAWVTIDDRGPYVGKRIIDVSLGTARKLGFERQGLTRVKLQVWRRHRHKKPR